MARRSAAALLALACLLGLHASTAHAQLLRGTGTLMERVNASAGLLDRANGSAALGSGGLIRPGGILSALLNATAAPTAKPTPAPTTAPRNTTTREPILGSGGLLRDNSIIGTLLRDAANSSGVLPPASSGAAPTPAPAAGGGLVAGRATCPVKLNVTAIDFAPIATACVRGPNFCSACICEIADLYMPAFIAGGLFANVTAATTANSFPMAKAEGIITACTTADLLLPMRAAGVTITELTRLSSCNFTDVPPCLIQKMTAGALAAAAAGAAPPVTASNGLNDDEEYLTDEGTPSGPARASSFRITATAAPQGNDGPIMATIAGEAKTVGDVTAAVLALPADFKRFLSPAAQAIIAQWNSNASFAAAPLDADTKAALVPAAGASSMVDLTAVLTGIALMQQRMAEAPAANPAANPTAAPAAPTVAEPSAAPATDPAPADPAPVVDSPKAADPAPVVAAPAEPDAKPATQPAAQVKSPAPVVSNPAPVVANPVPAPASGSASGPAKQGVAQLAMAALGALALSRLVGVSAL